MYANVHGPVNFERGIMTHIRTTFPLDEALELADAYAAESGVPVRVCAAFIMADREPPTAAQYDRGFDSAQLRLVQAFYDA